MTARPLPMPDCPVCFGPCGPAHGASLRVRAWFRAELARKLAPPTPSQGKREWNPDIHTINHVPKKPPAPPKEPKPLCRICNQRESITLGICRHCYDKRRKRSAPKAEPKYPTTLLLEMRGRGLTYAAMGKELGMHPSTIHQRLHRRSK